VKRNQVQARNYFGGEGGLLNMAINFRSQRERIIYRLAR
jgi:hypothetical protein